MQEIILKLNVNKTNTILAALSELPFKLSADFIADIRNQAQEQLEEAQTQEQL